MPLIQGGPPEWIWERKPGVLKWGVVLSEGPGGPSFELRLNCGLEIVRLQFFSEDELRALGAMLTSHPEPAAPDIVQEASEESFPASDAPAWTAGP